MNNFFLSQKITLCILFIFCGTVTKAQVQWAAEVLQVSSEIVSGSDHQFCANQILGKPNVLPQKGILHPCSWMPEKDDFRANITVGFARPIRIRQVAIAQSFLAGGIAKVWLIDQMQKSHLVYDAQVIIPRTRGGMLNIYMKRRTFFKVYAVRIEMDGSDQYGLTCIDAVGISPSTEPIEAKINLMPTSLTKSPPMVYVENLGKGVNTPYEEIMPVISSDGKRLYFDRKNHPENFGIRKNQPHNDDIWYADLQPNGKFMEAVHMESPLNNASHNYVCSVSPDGNTLLLGNKYVRNTCFAGLSISKRIKQGEHNVWSFPQEVHIDNYYNLAPFGEFYLSHNQKILLFSIKRRDTKGDRDLYVSFLKKDQTWTQPKSLGGQINSAGLEMTPFLAADENTLYFSSDGFSGYGDVDMFVTRRLDDSWTNWSEPVNLGLEFNSPDWDASYSIDAAGEYAYFASYNNSMNKSADIFRAKLPPSVKPDPVVLVYGKVRDYKTKKPLAAQIHYETLSGSKKSGTAISNPNTGAYKIILPLHQIYSFWVGAKGYLLSDKQINLTDSTNYVELELDLFLKPIEVGQSVQLKHIFFEQNKSNLTSASFPELNRIVQILVENPNLVIQIEGHTDLGGNPNKMLKLSTKRVLAVKDYLVQKKINPERVKVKAYGSQQPRFEFKHPSNRRVEFKVLKN